MTLELVRGDTRQTLTVTVTNPETGDPVTIFGSELTFTIRGVLSKTVGDGITILDTGAEDENQGKLTIAFEDGDWTDYALGTRTFAWDIQEVFGGKVETIAGTPLGDDPIRIVQDVTLAEAG